jgi:hypothetical protein
MENHSKLSQYVMRIHSLKVVTLQMTEIDRYAKVLHTLIKEEFDLVPIPAHFIMGNVLTSLIATIGDYRMAIQMLSNQPHSTKKRKSTY